MVVCPYGHIWTFSTDVQTVTQAEVEARAVQVYATDA
jgi:hypothetical protein